MTKIFTQTDLIRYLYRETTEKETKEIDNALICDSELQALYNELYAMKKSMDAAQLEPSSSAVLNILGYAQSLIESRT
jgi:hypothetical protein